MSDTISNDDLSTYLRQRLKYLETCNQYVEGKISEDLEEVTNRVNKKQLSEKSPEFQSIVSSLEYEIGATFRYSMLTALCSYVEDAFKQITVKLVQDYKAKIKAADGNWFNRHLAVLEECGLDIDPIIEDCNKFRQFISLRNSIVHAWGKIDASSNRDILKSIVAEGKWAVETKNGFLVLDDGTPIEAIICAENVVDHILRSKLNAKIT